jgi:hypothetical protein
MAEVLVGTILTRVGLPGLKPLPWVQTGAIFAYAMVTCLIVNDAAKVAMIRLGAQLSCDRSDGPQVTVGLHPIPVGRGKESDYNPLTNRRQ